MKLRFLILILCFCCSFISSAEEIFTDYGTRVSFSEYSQDYFAIRRFIIKLEKNIVKLLKLRIEEQPDVQLTIFLTKPGSKFKIDFTKRRMNVYLSVRFQDWDSDVEVLHRLICCFYTVFCKVPVMDDATLQKAVPLWIQVGTLEYLRNRTTLGYSGFRFYPLLRNAELAGIEPDPDDIINSKVTRTEGVLFYYYRELCELMLDWISHISSYSDRLLYGMIRKMAGGTAPVDAFYTVGMKQMLKKVGTRLRNDSELSDRDKIRTWFRRKLRKEVVSGFMPIPAEQSLAGLKKLLTVKYEYKEKDGGIIEKSCPLDQLGASWEKVNNRMVVLRSLKRLLNKLGQESASEFIRPLNIIDDTLNSLPKIKTEDEKRQESEKQKKKSGKRPGIKGKSKQPKNKKEDIFNPAEFQRNIKAAISCFADLVKRRQEIEAYLDRSAVEFIPLRERYKYLIKTLDVLEVNDRKIRPELNKYLDQVEKDYIED